MVNNEIEEVLKREEDFHDNWAESERIEDIDVYAIFESMASFENKYIIDQMGDLRGKTVLDIGAGLGESSVYFALKGAEVSYNDISPKMGEFAHKLADRYNVTMKYIIDPIEKINLSNQKFDFIHCANLMHHIPLEDQESWIKTMSDTLNEGGVLFTWDPLKYNPLINIYRNIATEVRTIDEMPLGFDILKIYKKYFREVKHQEYWFTNLFIFIYYYTIKRYDPNKIRYWKQIYKEDESKIGWWFKSLSTIDRLLFKLPFVNYMAWTITIQAKK